MYETTYQSQFAVRTPPQNKYQSHRNRNSIYAIESPKVESSALPPLDAGKPVAQRSSSAAAVDVSQRPNVQRSGFWCENPTYSTPGAYPKDHFTTTTESSYKPPPKASFENLTKKSQGFKTITPYAREPITIPQEPVEDYRTTNDLFYQKPKSRDMSMPGHVVMEPTGFQRGSDGSIDFGLNGKQSQLTQIELDRLKYKDPVAYLSAKAGDNPFVSMNQLYYQNPTAKNNKK